MCVARSLIGAGLGFLFTLTCVPAAARDSTNYNMYCLGVDSVVDTNGARARRIYASPVLSLLPVEADRMEEAFIAYLADSYPYKGVRSIHCGGDPTLAVAQAIKSKELKEEQYAHAEIIETDWRYPPPPSR